MNDWLHEHHVVWLALAVFAAVFVLAAAVYLLVTRLATGERGRAFARVSPGMLPPLGVIFGLLVGFMAVQVWNDAEEARRASTVRRAHCVRPCCSRSGSGSAAGTDPPSCAGTCNTAAEEWPAMADQQATLTAVPAALGASLQQLALQPRDEARRSRNASW